MELAGRASEFVALVRYFTGMHLSNVTAVQDGDGLVHAESVQCDFTYCSGLDERDWNVLLQVWSTELAFPC